MKNSMNANENLNSASLSPVDLRDLTDYGTICERLTLSLLPAEGNEQLMARCPYRMAEDLILTCCIAVENTDSFSASVRVTRQMLEAYGISEEQLFCDALHFAPLTHPAAMRSIRQVLAGLLNPDETLPPDTGDDCLYVVSNDCISGAACLFYPGFMAACAVRLGSGYYILPSSIHEVLLLPDSACSDYHDLTRMVQDINSSEVAPQDRLSDTVYHYDPSEELFETAAAYNSRLLPSAV